MSEAKKEKASVRDGHLCRSRVNEIAALRDYLNGISLLTHCLLSVCWALRDVERAGQKFVTISINS